MDSGAKVENLRMLISRVNTRLGEFGVNVESVRKDMMADFDKIYNAPCRHTWVYQTEGSRCTGRRCSNCHIFEQ